MALNNSQVSESNHLIVSNISKVIKLFYFKPCTLPLNTSSFPSGIDTIFWCPFLQLKLALEVRYVTIQRPLWSFITLRPSHSNIRAPWRQASAFSTSSCFTQPRNEQSCWETQTLHAIQLTADQSLFTCSNNSAEHKKGNFVGAFILDWQHQQKLE